MRESSVSKVEKNDSGKFCKFKLLWRHEFLHSFPLLLLYFLGVKIVPSLELKETNTYNSWVRKILSNAVDVESCCFYQKWRKNLSMKILLHKHQHEWLESTFYLKFWYYQYLKYLRVICNCIILNESINVNNIIAVYLFTYFYVMF